jgi:hypothetical protein
MDFIEVRLDPALHNRRLVVEFQAQGGGARFDVQMWRLDAGEVRPRALTGHPEATVPGQDGLHVYTIPQMDATAYDRLALIITRLDADEAVDTEGGYTITLECR